MKPYYEHAGITIYHGDCREVLPHLKADAVVTDPPYGMGKAEWDETIVPPESWMNHCGTLPLAVFVGVRGVYDYPRPEWIAAWHRPASTQRAGRLRGFNNWEPILLYNITALPNDTITCANLHENLGHPTVKPLALMKRVVAWFPGDTILDPFMGSGTTLRAAKDLGRKAIGIEIEERYCEIAAKRLSQEVLTFAAPPEPHNAGRSKTCCTWDTCGCTAYVGGER
jgi:DNA modification methylase